MEKRVISFCMSLVFLILVLSVISAAEIDISDETNSESSQVRDARDCLNDKVDDEECDNLSPEERLFALMGSGKCSSEVREDSRFKKDIKYTSQAILGLNGNSDAEKWLISQNTTFSEIDWFLQIDSSEITTCDVTYGGSSSKIIIDDDKTIDTNAGSCLTLSQGGYWLKISDSSSCQSKEFEVTCNKDFQTSLLFKKKDSPTIYVSSEVNGAPAEGTTREKIDTVCFSTGSVCDYEANLWAIIALDSEYETDPFKPYLLTMADEDENDKFLPEAFLAAIGDDSFRNKLLSEQESSKWWDKSGNKFYDTAVALIPFSGDSSEPQEKTDTKDWLLEIQGDDGCWNNGNIRDTGFLLYSLWPRASGSGGGGGSSGNSCTSSGNYCISTRECDTAGGDELSGSCIRPNICCSEDKVTKSCAEWGGDVCTSEEGCTGGRDERDISNELDFGEFCCVDGTCEVQNEPIISTECELQFGSCRVSCGDGKKQADYDCSGSNICCVTDFPSKTNYTIIWILGILVILVILGIVFRDKLRRLLVRFKSRGGKSKLRPGGPFSMPPPSSRMPMRRSPRRMPPRMGGPRPPGPGRFPLRRPPARKKPGELDSVLKKLKEMGK